MIYKQQELNEALIKLPQKVQNYIFSEDLATIIGDVARSYSLSSEKHALLGREVGYVLLGLEIESSFNNSIKDILGLSDDQTKTLIEVVSKNIFVPSKNLPDIGNEAIIDTPNQIKPEAELMPEVLPLPKVPGIPNSFLPPLRVKPSVPNNLPTGQQAPRPASQPVMPSRPMSQPLTQPMMQPMSQPAPKPASMLDAKLGATTSLPKEKVDLTAATPPKKLYPNGQDPYREPAQ